MSPANAAYTAEEVAYQIKDSGAKCIWTCLPLLQTTLQAAEKVGLPKNKVFLLDMPQEFLGSAKAPAGFGTFEDFVEKGKKLRQLEELKWKKGDAKKKVAFLCYSSGTSGPPVRIVGQDWRI